MKEYTFNISETYSRNVIIEAKNEEDAKRLVTRMYEQDIISVDPRKNFEDNSITLMDDGVTGATITREMVERCEPGYYAEEDKA